MNSRSSLLSLSSERISWRYSELLVEVLLASFSGQALELSSNGGYLILLVGFQHCQFLKRLSLDGLGHCLDLLLYGLLTSL